MSESSYKLSVLDSSKLVERLKKGSAILFPTDTVPALGAYPKYAPKLWKIKKRSFEKPLILMGANSEELFKFVDPSALRDAYEMASLYWPGPLTLALPTIGSSLHSLNFNSQTIGMRVPNSEVARNLLLKSGPLATTSANLSGELPSLNAEKTSASFPDLPLLGPIPWPKTSGLASTVILWKKSGSWQLIRQGSVSPEIASIN